jgi:hypothetical protein
VYTGTDDGVFGLDFQTGSVLWRGTDARSMQTSPTVVDSYVVFVSLLEVGAYSVA